MHIWKQKDIWKQTAKKKVKRLSWGGKVKGLVSDTEKNNLLSQRAETLLLNLRHRFPGLPQSTLDMTKIQYNKVYLLLVILMNLNSKDVSMSHMWFTDYWSCYSSAIFYTLYYSFNF